MHDQHLDDLAPVAEILRAVLKGDSMRLEMCDGGIEGAFVSNQPTGCDIAGLGRLLNLNAVRPFIHLQEQHSRIVKRPEAQDLLSICSPDSQVWMCCNDIGQFLDLKHKNVLSGGSPWILSIDG